MTTALFGALRQMGRVAGPASTPPQSITVSVPLSSALVVQGYTVPRAVVLSRVGGFTGDVTLSVENLPTGVSGVFVPQPLTGATVDAVLTLTAAVDADIVVGQTITVRATGTGVADATATFALTVTDLDLEHWGTGPSSVSKPTHTSNNTPGSGASHYPTTPAQLNTLFTGGNIGTGVLAAGDNIYLVKGTCYNSLTYYRHIFPDIAGAIANPITVWGSTDMGDLPAPGRRWIPADHRDATPHFRAFVGSETPVIVPPRTGGWRFVGVQVDDGGKTYLFGLVRLGTIGQSAWLVGTTYPINYQVYGSPAWISKANGNVGNPLEEGAWWRKVAVTDFAQNICFDRCDIACLTHNSAQNILYGNATNVSILGSHLWNEGMNGVETKCIAVQDTEGLWRIDNTQMSDPSMTMMVGGGDPAVQNQNPANFTISRCWFYRPLRWNRYHADWDGLSRVVKNLFEFKRMIGAVIEDTVLENGWDGGTYQFYDLVMKAANQQGHNEGAITSGITLRYLKFVNTQGPFGIGARDNYGGGTAPAPVADVSIYECYSPTLTGNLPGAGTTQYMVQFARDIDNLFFGYCTFFADPAKDSRTIYCNQYKLTGPFSWTWQDLVLSMNVPGYTMGSDSLATVGAEYFTQNPGNTASGINGMFQGGNPGAKFTVPPFVKFYTPDDMVVNYAGGDFHVIPALVGTGVGGRTPGANIDVVDARTSGCTTGVWD